MANQRITGMVRQNRADFGQRLGAIQPAVDLPVKSAWGKVEKGLRPALEALNQVADEQGADARAFKAHNSAAQLGQVTRDELGKMAPILRKDSIQGAQLGSRAGVDYATTAMGENGVNVPVFVPNPAQLAAYTDYVNSHAFQAVIAQFAGYHADQAVALLNAGVAKGKNPRTIAAEIANYITTFPEVDALRIVRTVTIWSMRSAAHETFRDNADALDGWIWSASLDNRCCMSCVALNGTFHTLDETLNDHDSGRCAPAPVTKSWADLGFSTGSEVPAVQSGVDWFNEQDQATQQDMMGKAAWAAWQAGEFDIANYPTTYESAVYGQQQRAQSLTELIGAALAKQYVRDGRGQ